MPSNPLVNQGVLNRLRGAVSVLDNATLNVTASYLGDDGISLAFEGDASDYLGQMTGAVPSPRPYQVCTVTMHLLKTQGLAAAWKAQMETNTSIGDIAVTTDSVTLPDYDLSNCTIKGVSELAFNGKTADYAVTIQGIYYINSGLFST